MPLIDVNGTTLAYDDSGPADRPAVLLSHSLFFDRSMFDALAARCRAEGYRTVAYDHRNQGGSATSDAEVVDLDTLTEDAAALVEALALGPCHAVGNSLGGFVALRLAARRPNLLLTASTLGSSAETENKLAEYEGLLEVFVEHGPAPLLDVLMGVMFGATTLAGRPDLTRPWRESMATLPPTMAASIRGVIHRSAVLDELAGCRVPVLAVAGAEDVTYPAPISGATIAEAAGGRTVTIEDAGHSVALEQPDLVAEQLLPHLASRPSS